MDLFLKRISIYFLILQLLHEKIAKSFHFLSLLRLRLSFISFKVEKSIVLPLKHRI